MPTFFVSPFGDNTANGTLEAPVQTITEGVKRLKTPGDTLFIRGGNYAENVRVAGKKGTAEAPYSIRAYGRERVTIDGAEPVDVDGLSAQFRIGGNHEWKLASEEDPEAHPDEYLSVHCFPTGDNDLVRHGAFMDREPYTRLITYSQLEDLRAPNQTFGRLLLDDPLPPFPGFPVVDEHGHHVQFKQPGGKLIKCFKHPWVYMGPGLFFDADGRIHIRLSHTENHIPGIVDYDGGTDPRQLRLAISCLTPASLVVENCSFVRIDHLEVRFGGERTIRISTSEDVILDHVRVCAASEGIRLGEGDLRVVLRHCEVLGGLPPWMFRSDLKDVYRAKRPDGTIIDNNLGHGTIQTLFLGVESDVDTVVHNCEFVDGHDMAMFGRGTRFHHNWVHNMNDDGLIMDIAHTEDLEVAQNVIMRCLEAFSFAQDKPQHLGGARRVHRNLIDFRSPTAGRRPYPSGHLLSNNDENDAASVFRYGHFYKSDQPDGPLDLFHNTCLVANQATNAGFNQFRPSDHPDNGVRRAVNNIYVDVRPSPERPAEYATAFVPNPAFHGPTDATCFFQVTDEPISVLRHEPFGPNAGQSFPSVAAYKASAHQDASTANYPPGFEENSVEGDPVFRSIATDGVPQFDDDLRLTDDTSIAFEQGRTLSDADIGIDDPLAQPGAPDLGCYQLEDIGLDVGVDGRRRFPEQP